MARSSELRVGTFTDDDGIARIGLLRVLLADDTHPEETRTKGGIWVARTDRDALTAALASALDFAQALSDALEASPKAAPKAARKAPTPPAKPAPAPARVIAPAPVSEGVRANRAIAEAVAPKPEREAIIAKARAERAALSVAPAARVSKPAPAKVAKPLDNSDMLDWLDAIRA